MSVIVDITIEMKDGSIGAKKFGAFDTKSAHEMVDAMVRDANRDGMVKRHRVSVTQDKNYEYVPRILQTEAV